MKLKQRQWIAILGIVISVVACCMVFKDIDFQELLKTTRQIPFLYLVAICLFYLGTPLLRAYRWRLTLPNHRKYLNGVVIGFAGNNVLPARGGELIRMEYFFRFNPHQSRITIISSILTNKLLDGVALIVLLLASVAVLDLKEQPWISTIVQTVCLILGISFAVVLSVRIFGNAIKLQLLPYSSTFIKNILILVDRIQQSVLFLRWDLRTLLVLLTSLGIWMLEAGMFITCLHAFLPQQQVFWLGIFTLTIVNFGIILPSSPGYLGVFQAMTLLALSPFGISEHVALSEGLIVNFFQFLPITLWGLLVVWDWRLGDGVIE